MDISEAAFGLLEGCGEDGDVGFASVEDGVKGEDEGFESGFCGSSGRGDGEASAGALDEGLWAKGLLVELE